MKKIASLLPFLSVLVFYTGLAYAGTGGTEFSEIYELVVGWSQGALGKVFAVGAFLVGIGAGIIRQSLMPVVTGIGTAVSVYYLPTIVDGVVTATM